MTALRPWLGPLALALLVLATYHEVGDFALLLLDDPLYVTSNPQVLQGLTLDSILWAFFHDTYHHSIWMPLTWLSLMTDISLFGPNPAALHWVNLALFLATVLLLNRFLRLATGAPWRSWLAVALFALHPLRVESVAWVTERKDMLFLLFLTLALLAYRRAVAHRAGQPLDLRSQGATLFWFLCAITSKPTALVLPALLLALDHWPLQRGSLGWRPLTLEKIPAGLLALLFLVVNNSGQGHQRVLEGAEVTGLAERLIEACVRILAYLKLTVWPQDLMVQYESGTRHLAVGGPLAGVGAVLLLTYLTWRWRTVHPFLLTGWAWFVVALTPTLHLVSLPIVPLADRFTYLPHVGLAVAVVWGIRALLDRWPLGVRAAGALGMVLVLAGGVASQAQARYWRDDLTLFRRGLALAPDNRHLTSYLGLAQLQKEQWAEALETYQQAIRLAPGHHMMHFLAGYCLLRLDRPAEADVHLTRSARLVTGRTNGWDRLGVGLLAWGQFGPAVRYLGNAVAQDPQDLQVRLHLALALILDRKFRDAELHLAHLAGQPRAPNGVAFHLGWVRNRLARPGDALPPLDQARAATPDDPEVLFESAYARLALGDSAGLALLERCRTLPGAPPLAIGLSEALRNAGAGADLAQSVADWTRANRAALDQALPWIPPAVADPGDDPTLRPPGGRRS
ncbi:MAG: hypothetical protein HQL82_13870 [Magnetococcales bacterium]|nr:hypothetical protein [Magnetococcales bacterium]